MHILTWDHINMTWLWKSKQLRFMSCPQSAYVVWLNTVQWLLTRHCADRCSALPFREGTHGGERTEWESDTFTPRRQVACGASPHSLSLSSSWFSGVWFSRGEIQAGAGDFNEDERRRRGRRVGWRAAHQKQSLWTNPRLEKVEASGGKVWAGWRWMSSPELCIKTSMTSVECQHPKRKSRLWKQCQFIFF